MATEITARLSEHLPSIALDVPVAVGARTLEVRWIVAGPLDDTTTAWFDRFPTTTESRLDAYLMAPRLWGLSVKIRGEEALEVKVHGGIIGVVDLPERVEGRLDAWQKWSFPMAHDGHETADPAVWRRVQKDRRIVRFDERGAALPGNEPSAEALLVEAVCAVELTRVEVDGTPWWTLGFEAAGPPDRRRAAIEAAAAALFTTPFPAGELHLGLSGPYVEWLQRLHLAG